MAVTQIGAPSVQSAFGNFSAVINYDSTANAVSIIPSGTGHALLKLWDNTVTPAVLQGSCWLDQFGTTQGTLTDGHSDSPVTYDGTTSHLVAGPGAVGVQADGTALPTKNVSGKIVGALNPPKGSPASLAIELDWTAN